MEVIEMKPALIERRLEAMCENKFYDSSGPIATRDNCFYQCDGYNTSCPGYRAIVTTQKPYRKGSLSIKFFMVR